MTSQPNVNCSVATITTTTTTATTNNPDPVPVVQEEVSDQDITALPDLNGFALSAMIIADLLLPMEARRVLWEKTAAKVVQELSTV